MFCINKVFILGYLKNNPEKRYMASGNVISVINVLTMSSWKNKINGNVFRYSESHRIILYNKLAEYVCDYLNKGSIVYVEGFIRTVKVLSSSSSTKFIKEIVASDIQFVDFNNKVSSALDSIDYELKINKDINYLVDNDISF